MKALPEKGRANEAVIALLAYRLGVEASNISVVGGHAASAKVVAIDGMDDEAIRQSLSHEKPGKTSGMRNPE